MSLGRLALISLAVGALVAFVAMLSVDVILPWDDYTNVLDVPRETREKLSQMSPDEVNNQLLKGTIALKAVNGVQKIYYILSVSPQYFAYRWAYFLVPCVVAAFIGGLLVTWRRGA